MATELEGFGIIEVVGNHGGLMASLTPAGIGYLQEIDDKASIGKPGNPDV